MTKIQVNSQGKAYTDSNGKVLLANEVSTPAVIESLNVTPTTSAQTITAPSGIDGYSPINVSAVTSSIDSNITAENIKKDVSILGVTGTYEGSGGSSDKYTLYQVVKDDYGNDVGVVAGFTLNSDGSKKHAIVYTLVLGSVSWSTNSSYTSYNNWNSLDLSRETATTRCDEILTRQPSSSVANCRNYSCTIDNVTYYGQLATYAESVVIASASNQINDIISDSSNTLSNSISKNTVYITSSQRTTSQIWGVLANGNTGQTSGSRNGFVIFELPMSSS